MKYALLIYFSFLLLFNLHCQKETNNWFFGNNAGLSFVTNTPVPTPSSAISTSAGCSSISDANGNLLFYSDGISIWNQNHSIMANGAGLSGSNCAQSSVIIQQPGSSHLYYVFTVNGGGNAPGLCYSIVNMSLSAGLGSVTVKNATLYAPALAEKLAATRHCNQSDVWIMTHETGGSSNYRAYLLTSAGVGTSAVISSVGIAHNNSSNFGSCKFSPNGKRFGAVYTVPTGTSLGVTALQAELYSFDNSSGTLSPWLSNGPMVISGSSPLGNNWAYGTEFSPNSSKFFFTYYNQVAQVDLCGSYWDYGIAINPPLSESNTINPQTAFKGTLQLGRNGKIYVTHSGAGSLSVINNPNLVGIMNVGYVPNAQSLSSGVCRMGLPNFLSSYFEEMPGPFTYSVLPYPNCNVLSFTAPTVCAASGYSVSGRMWNFGDIASGNNNTSSQAAVTHTFSSGGTYTVKLITNYYCNKNDTLVKVITVTNPSVSIVTSPVNCSSYSASVAISGGSGQYSYTWTPGNMNSATVSSLTGGSYFVTIKDMNSGCIGSFSTQINILNTAIVASPALCYQSANGSALVSANGGSGSYSYSWSPGAQTSSLITGLTAGVYTVTVFDLNNPPCSVSNTIMINQPLPLTLNLAASSATACTGSSVQLSATVSGGTPAYSGQWLGGQSLVTHTNPGTYTYTYTASDANSCTVQGSVSFDVINPPSLNVTSTVVCGLTPVTLSVSGANSYTWNPWQVTGSSHTLVPASTIVYSVIGNTGGCFSSGTGTITTLPLPVYSYSSNQASCSGQSLSLSASGNAGFTWAGPSGFSSNQGNTIVFNITPSHSGIYTLNALGNNGCLSTSTISVLVNITPTITVSGNSLCAGQSSTLLASGAGQYFWLPSGATTHSVVSSPNSSTVYTITGTSFSCSTTQTVLVSVYPLPAAQAALSYPPCTGQTVYLSGNGGVAYNWAGPLGFSSTSQNPVIAPAQLNHSGNYTVTVTNSHACSAQSTVYVLVSPGPQLTVSGNKFICLGEPVTLSASGANNISWSNGATTATTMVFPNTSTSYTASGSNIGGSCVAKAVITVSVLTCEGINTTTNETPFIVYPNPVKEKIYFSSLENTCYDLEIYNSIGQVLEKRTTCLPVTEIDLFRLPKSVYYFKITLNNKSISGKFIKE